MRVFLTGASGHLGLAVARRLAAAGNAVHGLARGTVAAERLRKMNVTPVAGQMEDEQLVRSQLQQADAVVHCAVDLGSDWHGTIELDRRFCSWLVEDCADRDCRIVLSEGPGVYGDTGNQVMTEDSPIGDTRVRQAEQIVFADKELSAIVLRLPVVVYGEAGGLVLPALIQAALKHQQSSVIEDGGNVFSTVHVEDAAMLYLKALQSDERGAFLVSGGVDVSLYALAAAIARMLDYPLKRITAGEAARLWAPGWARLLSCNHRLSGAAAMRVFGWQPRNQPSILEDLEAGSYAARFLRSAIPHPR